MRLQLDVIGVSRAGFGSRSGLSGRLLTIEREKLGALLALDPRLQSVDVQVTNNQIGANRVSIDEY